VGLPNVMQTGRSAMNAAKTAIATAGHNIANANTDGYARQRVEQAAAPGGNKPGSRTEVGRGVGAVNVSRINDEYVEKQLRNSMRDLSHAEEKDLFLRQTEDIFNELNGEGLNRLMTRFFNEFRKLGNEPDNEAVRQSVRESTKALVNDIKRMRGEVDEVRRHIDSRMDGYVREVNSLSEELRDLNLKIKTTEIGGGKPNDLLDRRDAVLKKLGSFMDLQMHKDNEGGYVVNIKGVGPLVAGPLFTKFSTERTPADDQGKIEDALDIKSEASVAGKVTHQVGGGKIGALVETRDKLLSTIVDRLDQLAFGLTTAVNTIHSQGVNRYGESGTAFFKPLDTSFRASEFMDLSDEVKNNVNSIATAAEPDAPGDNRIAIAISGLQGQKLLNEGNATIDDFYNSIVSDIGVANSRNRSVLTQQRDISTQLGKIREQVSGVSIDEETANLLQFQHAFDASAKVIQIADECLRTVLELRR
jgi:flagellar hook-associated protein 1 FlgK